MTPTKEGLSRVKALKTLCKQNGVELIEKPNGHYQIKGVYLVNYYPFSKDQSIYVAATAARSKVTSPQRAVLIAAGKCLDWKVSAKDTRPGNTKGRRKKIWERGVRKCHWCQTEFASFSETTLEHIIPLSKGGLDNPNNYALAHKKCNHDRGNLLPHRERPAPAHDGEVSGQ